MYSSAQLAFSPDGRYLAAENQGTIQVWDTLMAQEAARWESGYTTQLVFSPDGRYLRRSDGTTASVWRWGQKD